MPKRSTPLQAMVHLVRKHLAEPGVSVTESKELMDKRPGIGAREVDIVVEGAFDGQRIVRSFEVAERRRRVDLTWVEQQIEKHRWLPTNHLILVSAAGFTKRALAAVASQNGKVEALQPELVDVDGQTEVGTLHVARTQLFPTICQVGVVEPWDGQRRLLDVTPGHPIYASDGTELGTAAQLCDEAVHLESTLHQFLKGGARHPDPDALKRFSLDLLIADLGYHLHNAIHEVFVGIRLLRIEGEFDFTLVDMPFVERQLGNDRFGAGEGAAFGRPALWVRTVDEVTGSVRISLKIDADVANPPAQERETLRFPGLLDLHEPPSDSVFPR